MNNLTEYITVESSMIKNAWYKSASQVLVLDYQNGNSYRYADVPDIVYERLRAADSKGRFINKNIITKFSFSKF